MLYRPTELKEFLNSLGIEPRKDLSQNFLIDGNVVRKIVDSGSLQPGDLVLEIGPGPGTLTEALLQKGVHLFAVEKDPVLAKALSRLQTSDQRLTVFLQDILHFDLEATLAPYIQKGKKAKVLANLPYHLTTPILTSLLPQTELFSELFLMVQKEVADRLLSPAGSKTYGAISLFVRTYSEVKLLCKVKRSCFYPAPSVDSAVVHFSLRKHPAVDNPETFLPFIRQAFQQRRKTLRNSLKELYAPEAITAALEQLGFNPDIRPEQLSLETFASLYGLLERT